MKIKVLKSVFQVIAGTICLVSVGCSNTGIYTKLTPFYDLAANQDKKIYICVEAPRSAAADVDAPDTLAAAISSHLVTRAKIKPDNILLAERGRGLTFDTLDTPEAAAMRAGAGLALFVRIEEYELMPLNIRDYHSGRMATRAVLLDAKTGESLWPSGRRGKVHDIVIELGKEDRRGILLRMTAATAHCILRNLYPIEKMLYRNSDERVSQEDVFELETF